MHMQYWTSCKKAYISCAMRNKYTKIHDFLYFWIIIRQYLLKINHDTRNFYLYHSCYYFSCTKYSIEPICSVCIVKNSGFTRKPIRMWIAWLFLLHHKRIFRYYTSYQCNKYLGEQKIPSMGIPLLNLLLKPSEFQLFIFHEFHIHA